VNPLEVTYSLAADSPPAMPLEVYEERLILAWNELLRSGPTEREVQAFLEAHPSLVPGAHVGLGRVGQSGHAPFPGGRRLLLLAARLRSSARAYSRAARPLRPRATRTQDCPTTTAPQVRPTPA